MIIRGTPKNIGDYIKADCQINLMLISKGFMADYIDGEYVYYKRTQELLDIIEKEGFDVE
jgi:hypothetical protein